MTTSRTGKRPIRISVKSGRTGAFTLVELVLVMALLIIVLSVSAPSLSRFFKGRSMDSEARQLVSLTHYAQNRAAAEGVPMVLWIDVAERTYGLHEDEAFDLNDPKAVDFELPKELHFEVPNRRALSLGLAKIRFLPDGTINESSVDVFGIEDDKRESLWIVQTENRLNYEIQSEIDAQRRINR